MSSANARVVCVGTTLRSSRKLGALAGALLVVLGTGCPGVTDSSSDNGVAGTWTLIKVNNQDVGTTGYELETGVFMKDMTLTFNLPRSGIVLGRYTTVENGTTKPAQTYSGTFVYEGDKSGGTVSITSFDEQVTGTVRRQSSVFVLEVKDQLVVAQGKNYTINALFSR